MRYNLSLRGSVPKKAGHVQTMTLDFGEYKGAHIKDVPNTYLGWLTKWEVDVDVDNGRIAKATKVNASNHFGPCPCGDCSALRFLETKPDVIEAARKLAELTGKPQAIYPLHCCLFN